MVSAEEFVKIWQTSKSTKEIVKRTQSNAKAVGVRAAIFRHKGVPLKKFRTARHDYVALAKLAAAYNGKK